MIVLTLCTALGIGFLSYLLFKKDSEIKNGVYKLPGKWYWLKRIVFYILFRVRSAKKNKETKILDLQQGNYSCEKDRIRGYGKGEGYGDMEKPQPLSEAPFAIDCAYFGAATKDGCNIVFRLARRKNRCAEIWLFLEVPGLGCFQFPHHPDTDVCYTDGNNFQAGGMTFEILEPMNKWKIKYSGKLRRGLCNDVVNKPEEFVEASLSFTWSAFSQPFNFDTDMACSVLGDSISREIWDRAFFQRLKDNHQTHYEQWGELRGRLSLEGYEEKQLFLQCVRDHSYGTRDWRSFYRYIIHFIYVESGMSIQVGVVSQPNLMTHVKIGYVSYGNGDIVSVSDVKLNLWEVGEETKDPPSTWTFSFEADGQTYKVKATKGTTPVWYHHEDRGGKVMEVFTKFEVNSLKGWGISEYFYRNPNGPSMTVPPTPCPLIFEPSEDDIKNSFGEITLPFTNIACSSPVLVGGKGAQLSHLTSIQTDVGAEVPSGFCLTLKSFEHQLQENKNILSSIGSISEAAVSNLSDLPLVCNTAVELISGTDICPVVKTAILQALKDSVGTGYENIHFAVRSSAAGEDGIEASSAGQMETFLGVVGFSQILESVKRCWASVYTVQAVEYRRQHGQSIHVLVGVVIQKMVPAESAGVLFTADPLSGSSSFIVINANFGLGESVVSGKADPDMIVVQRDPEVLYSTQNLRVSKVRVGVKRTRITGAESGVTEEFVNGDSKCVCISESMILRLAALGIELEKRFGSPRDIEWAVVGENIYLLQCRPITVTENETENELIHEFDSPMTCDNLWLTTSNISEMMPGAVTPLTLSTFRNSIEYSLQTLNMYTGARKRATHLPKSLPSHCNHLFISLLEISTLIMTALMVSVDILEVNLLGGLLPEFTQQNIEKYYGLPRKGFWQRCLNFFSMLRMWSKANRLTDQWEKRIPTYQVGPQAATATELYKCISEQLVDYETVWVWTLINSGRSGNMSNILMSFVGGDPSGWTSEHYGDIALLLSKCDGVYSAEVPHAMENIAREIAKTDSQFVESFLATHNEDCMKLLNDQPLFMKMVSEFLGRHGHRCLRESELREKSWRSAPEKFISVLKIILKTKSYTEKLRNEISVSDLLNKMKTKVPFHKRLIMKFLLPKAWKAVGDREWGKSVSVQMSEIFKLAYARLASLLHKEGRLPDADLMYFLTHQEIGTLISSCSARLIIKAQKRRKILTKQLEMKFEKMNLSRPVPINFSSSKADNTSVECLKGMPVSQGQVRGPAQVVHRLEDAHIIKAGDILIVNSTDVGWSPYFPLIGGLVTELGGLISHGAVVAREYGIPCVVNVPHATSIIQTGEILQLDGRMGTVKRMHVEKSLT